MTAVPAGASRAAASGSPGQDVTFLIIGAGFAGLGAAIRLQQAGHTDMLVLERAEDVGGTWRDNTYPGCRCDVQSNLYSYSFAPKPDWSETFPSQPELWEYLRDIAGRHGLQRYLRFGHEVTERPLGRGHQPLAGQPPAGEFRRAVSDRRDSARWSSRRCPTSPASSVRRHDHALGALGPQLAGGGHTGSRSSAPARRRSRSCRRFSRRSST